MILCDIGNSFYHFYKDGEIFKESVDKTPQLFNKKIYYISVNNSATLKLKESNNLIDLSKRINFNTSYNGLGIDRVFACLNISNGVVVDAGSAITIDVMQNSTHLGGSILLGLLSHKKNYNSISNKLNFDLNREVNLNKLPQNTIDALSYASLKSTILIIKDISKDNKIYFTGGDGQFLSKFFINSIYDKNLIFNSMIRVIKDNKL